MQQATRSGGYTLPLVRLNPTSFCHHILRLLDSGRFNRSGGPKASVPNRCRLSPGSFRFDRAEPDWLSLGSFKSGSSARRANMPPVGNGSARGRSAGPGSPTKPSPKPPGLSSVLERNIATLKARREREEAEATLQARVADAITRFTGSMPFVYIHLVVYGFWIAANLGWIPGVPKWDESFVILAREASVEAIFLSTFVLISQNRMAAAADKRADLDLQISLLAEHELTKLTTLVGEIAQKLGVETAVDEELYEIEQDVAPDAVLDVIEETEDRKPN